MRRSEGAEERFLQCAKQIVEWIFFDQPPRCLAPRRDRLKPTVRNQRLGRRPACRRPRCVTHVDANGVERFVVTAPPDRIGKRFVCLDDFAKPLRRRPGAGIRMVAPGKGSEVRSNRCLISLRRYIQYEVVVYSSPSLKPSARRSIRSVP